MKRFVLSGLLTLGLATPVAVLAGGSPRAHDGGVFLRLSGGVTGASTSADDGNDKVELTGGGGDLNIAIGGIIANNLALHGTLWGWSIGSPTLKLNGDEVDTGNSSISLGAIGGGVTYYAMPINIYLSGSVGLGRLRVEASTGGQARSDSGIALDATIGKEWWVGDNWGLGLAFAFTYHSIKDGTADATFSGPSYGLRFSASMN